MKALRFHDWGGPLQLEQVPDPAPAGDEVLVRVLACSIGLTVLNLMRGDVGNDPAFLPRIPGHEVVGRIEDVGSGVDTARIGELVACYTYLFCGRCRRCLAGRESLCDNLAGLVSVNRDGGYAELCVLPERNAVALPPQLDPITASVVPDALSTSVHVCNRGRIAPGDHVAVIGAGGGVGIHLAQAARTFGAEVVGLDLDAAKLAFLHDELGIDGADSSDLDNVQLPQHWHGRADVIVDLVGQRSTFSWAKSSLDTDGRLVVLTTFPGVDVPVSPRELVSRQVAILGSRAFSRSEMLIACELLATGRVRPVVTERVGFEGVEHVHDLLRRGSLLGRGVLVPA